MLGAGIRRNIATVSRGERDRFRDAIVELHTLPQFHDPGSRTDTLGVGVSYRFKQNEIHRAWESKNEIPVSNSVGAAICTA